MCVIAYTAKGEDYAAVAAVAVANDDDDDEQKI